VRDDRDRRAADIGDVTEILHRVERGIRARCRRHNVRRNAGNDEGGAVGIGMGDRGRADHAARARPVLDHDALRERITEMLGEHAADQVGASPRRPRHHDPYRLIRPTFRRGLRRCGRRDAEPASEDNRSKP
jgi:hypothetical protein